MIKGHHLQHRSCPPFFHNFKQFNIKAAATHPPIIQKEVYELIVKGAPSSGGAGFYSNVFVFPRHTGGFWPILTLKQFNHYMHIPTFKVPTIRHVQQLIQHGDHAFSIDFKDAYFHISIVKYHHHFLWFVWQNNPCQWKVLPFWLVTLPRVFTALTKPIFVLCWCMGFCIGIYIDDILVLIHSKLAGKRPWSFLCSLLVHLG